MGRLSLCAFVMLISAIALPAEAQLDTGDFRFSIDADMLSISSFEFDLEGPAPASTTTVYGFGPNHLGGARATYNTPTPLGLGFGWVLTRKIVLGARIGLGLDVIDDDDGDDDKTRILGLSLMPGITFVPVGQHAKLFLSASPLLQVSRIKYDVGKSRYLVGGFGLGIGALFFVASTLSVDLGFHFEGRFGGYEDRNNVEADVRDLRGVIRLGLSLWK
jgi:hypothetical protein